MKKLFSLIAVAAISVTAFSQQNFTIEEAWKYATENNVNVKKAKIDEVIADQKVKETIGIGLPQVSAQGKYTNYIKIPILVVDFGGMTQELPMAQKQNVNSGVTVSQLLFNGSYIVGLKSSKIYKETTSLITEKTEISVKEGVLMTYAGILATEQSVKTLEENKVILDKNLNDTKVTYETGLIEFQNVEQLEYSQKNLATVIENLKRTKEKLTNALKYMIGYPLNEKIFLTSTLDEVLEKNTVLISNNDVNIDNHVDLRLKRNQIDIQEQLLKLEKSKALPTLASFFSSNANGVGSSFNNLIWNYPTLWGLQLDIPIFSGLQRHWKTQQAKLDLQKAEMDLEDTKRSLENNAYSATIDYQNAYNSFKNAEELIALSSSIYNKQQIKFKEGMGTSYELSQAESQLYDAQRQYYEAALNLIQAKTKLDEALGKL